MKILIISDTHGRLDLVPYAISKTNPDYIIHCGDICGDERELRELADRPVIVVPGNNDWLSRDPRDICVPFGKHKVFITHGDRYGAHFGTDKISYKAESMGCDIAVFGHTHCALIDDSGPVLLLNPGSLTFPRRSTFSFISVDVDENDDWKPEIHYITQ